MTPFELEEWFARSQDGSGFYGFHNQHGGLMQVGSGWGDGYDAYGLSEKFGDGYGELAPKQQRVSRGVQHLLVLATMLNDHRKR